MLKKLKNFFNFFLILISLIVQKLNFSNEIKFL